MNAEPPPVRDVFVVRRWRNPNGEWHSQIVVVANRQTINFGSDEALLRYMERHFLHQYRQNGTRNCLR